MHQKFGYSGFKFKRVWPKYKYGTGFERNLNSHNNYFIHTESLRLKIVIKFLNKKVSLNLNKLIHSKIEKFYSIGVNVI